MGFDSGKYPGHSRQPQGHSPRWQPQQWQPPQQPQQAPPPGWQPRQPQYPQQPPPYPPPQVFVQQVNQGPRSAVTRRPMSIAEGIFHAFMIVMTCGLWIPVYLARRRSLKTVTRFR